MMSFFNKLVGRLSRSNRNGKPRSARFRSEIAIEEDSKYMRLPRWLRPKVLKSFNFLFLHYLYMVAMAILASVILYAGGGMAYIDALFFACGSVTQSGLNTLNINNMKTYQQVVLVLFAIFCNPITINTFVVFVRLSWFEKRFQHVVLASRTARTRSRTMSQDKRFVDVEHTADQRKPHSVLVSKEELQKDLVTRSISQNDACSPNNLKLTKQETGLGSAPDIHKRDVIFADELKPGLRSLDKLAHSSLPNADRVPQPRSPAEQAGFRKSQRDSHDNTALRIPGPRDFERGDVPEKVVKTVAGNRPSGVLRRDSDHSVVEQFDAKGSSNSLKMLDQSRTEPLVDEPLKLCDSAIPPIGLLDRAQTFLSQTLSFGHHSIYENDPSPYLSYSATIGRNSTFIHLTEAQREELGGVEYRSLKTLIKLLLGYNIGFTLLGIIILLPWIVRTKTYTTVVTDVSQSPPWWGVFTAISMFTDLGFTLTPDSMISFNQAAVPLLLGTFLIIVGNTGFPIMLRFIIWITRAMVPRPSPVWEELCFLLDHPRRCFTLLFPSKATWWLFFVLIVFNGIDLIFFVILDLKDTIVTSLPPVYQFLAGLFQAAATRTAGFACVDLSELHPGIQVSYLIMMYVSVLPIAISIRNTNVYEENSLGIYNTVEDPADQDPERSYVASHLRRQLSFDLWYIFLGLFLICIIEGARIANVNDSAFNIFSIMFEIVSAYGTVGLSLGYPNTYTAFSGQFQVLSKLIIMAMMLRGRHRGLPYALDRAILLSSDVPKPDKLRRPSASQPTSAANASALDDELSARGRKRPRRPSQIARIVRGALIAGPP